MGYIIVAGGQFGSEGKGKVAEHFARTQKAAAVCRIGGTNSGHTVWVDDEPQRLRMLPTAALTTDCEIIFPAGSYINPKILCTEVMQYSIDMRRIHIDNNAMLISGADVTSEVYSDLKERIASTQSGTGASVITRVSRRSVDDTMQGCKNFEYGLITYKKFAELLCDTKQYMRKLLDAGETIVVEGTQGYGLSLLHTQHFPYCTARDTSAAGILSEVGGSIRDVDCIVTVFRTYPIRVGGNSGPLPLEITWEQVTDDAGAPFPLVERTTVTNRIRRVARLDVQFMNTVIRNERPDVVVLNHMDYTDWANKGQTFLSQKQQDFVSNLELQIGTHIDMFGNGEDILF